jgi:broad-specificity NMP kinase
VWATGGAQWPASPILGQAEPVDTERLPVGHCFAVSGAPGSGKSTLMPFLVDHCASVLVVLDMDELLSDGALLGVAIRTEDAVDRWPEYNALWSRVLSLVLRSRVPVLFLCPLLPAELVPAPADACTSWLLLDCSDERRRRRLAARGWSPAAVESAVEDGRQARAVISAQVSTDDDRPDQTAAAIMRWVSTCSR